MTGFVPDLAPEELQHTETRQWLTGEPAETLLRAYEENVLDCHYESLPYWIHLGESSAYSLLAAFDSLAFIPGLFDPRKHTVETVQLKKRIEDGLAQSVRWLFRAGKSSSILPQSSYTLIEKAGEFIWHAADYVDIADLHVSYGRGLETIAVDLASRHVRFDTVNDPQDIFGGSCFEDSAFEELGSARERRASLGPVRRNTFLRSLLSVHHSCLSGRIVLETVDPLAGAEMDDFVRRTWPSNAREVPDSVDLGGFTGGDFSSFWSALSRWSLCAFRLFIKHLEGGRPQHECMPSQVVERRLFVDRISQLGSLTQEKVEGILDRLTLGRAVERPEIFLQPFICSEKQVGWSVFVILASRFQRNMLKLMARQSEFKTLADNLIGGRERVMLHDFAAMLTNRGYQYCLTKSLRHADQDCEIDLLAWTSKARQQVLVVEWKAILLPDEINEVNEATDRLIEGQRQVIRSISQIRKAPVSLLREVFRFVPWQDVTELYGIVLSRDGGPNQRYDHSEIPASSIATIRARLRRTDLKTPQRIVRALQERRWLRELQDTSKHVHRAVPVGNVTYEIPCLAVEERST